VPIVRDPPLARALHRLTEVGDEIPEELYDAAAAVLAHLHGAPTRETE
jgi:flagellar biosynthesis protein FlhB